jgi:DNA-binding winged helix-turn-helix (wHTH) protein/TolB-like protein
MALDLESPDGQRLDLAKAPDFDLGAAHVSPSHRRVTIDGRSCKLEPRVMRVLVVLAAARPKVVSRDQLIETCWDGRIVSEDAITRCILSLRNLARSHTPELFHIETVRGVGYSLVVPPSAERLSEDGAGVERPSGGSRPDTTRPKPRLAPVVLALLVIVAAGLAFAGWRTLHAGTGAPPIARVEVAPFRALRAGDPDVTRVSQATRDAVIRVLRGTDIPVVEARTTGADATSDADFHLRGAVDRDGDAMVINAQLLDRDRRNVLWSGRFERSLSTPARFPDQAANRIGDMLHCALRSRAASNRPMTDAVLSLMLQACELRRPEPQDAPQFLAAAERLRDAAPQLSVAQSMYATAAAAKSALSPDTPDAAALATAARAAAGRALQLDSTNGEAYFAIGISYGFDRAWAAREANFLRAEALSQGFNIMGDIHVRLLREVGRLRDARELNLRTAADDPFGSDQVSTLILLTALTDGREAAEPLLQRFRLVASPEDTDGLRFNLTFWWDSPEAARALLATTDNGSVGLKSCFEDYLVEVERPSPHRGLPDSCRMLQLDWRIRMLAREGDIDGAYREIAQAPRGSSLLLALYYPEMRAFRADPRFMPLAARYGLVDYWARSGRWPDFCTESDRPYDCAAVARGLVDPSRPTPDLKPVPR